MIGEFHGILTMDSGETVKVIIPECIQIPPGLSNTYLLADSAFLMAGHQYISHLSKLKLKFKGGVISLQVLCPHQGSTGSQSKGAFCSTCSNHPIDMLSIVKYVIITKYIG